MRLSEAHLLEVREALKSLGNARNLADAVWLHMGLHLEDEVELRGGRNTVFTEAIRLAHGQGWLEGMIRAALARKPCSVPLQTLIARMDLPSLPMDAPLPDHPVSADDSALQAAIERRRPPILISRFTERLAAISRAVCWIGLRGGTGEEDVQWGTGVLVAPDLVLTNHHVAAPVLRREAEPTAVLLRFDRLAATSEGEAAELAESWHVADSAAAPSDVQAGAREPSKDELDFALLRLRQPPRRAPLAIPAEPPPLVKDDFVFVVQHPAETVDVEEGAQRISLGRVIGFEADALRVRHDASTALGSSGSPALTADLRPAALHHGAQPLRDTAGALVARVRSYNRAIPLRPILRMLREMPNVPPFWEATSDANGNTIL